MIPSPSPSVKIQIMGGKVCLRYKGKILLVVVNKLFVFKSLLTSSSNVLSLYLKQTFPPIIWIFTEGEGDEIQSRLPFEIFPTLKVFPYAHFFFKMHDSENNYWCKMIKRFQVQNSCIWQKFIAVNQWPTALKNGRTNLLSERSLVDYIAPQ